MSVKRVVLNTLLATAIGLSASPLAAETFSVQLGKTSLGQLVYTKSTSEEKLLSTLENTPLGVFNGTFAGSSKPAKAADGSAVQEFFGVSISSRKSREVTVQTASGRAVATKISPSTEETSLSDPSKVAGNVVNPVRAIGQLIAVTGCPKQINIYDGRRAIALVPGASKTKDDILTCDITYKVTAGPGHLSPLKISKAKMRVTYQLGDGTQSIRQIKIGSGVFNLLLNRVD